MSFDAKVAALAAIGGILGALDSRMFFICLYALGPGWLLNYWLN